jgi:hypothetical protein
VLFPSHDHQDPRNRTPLHLIHTQAFFQSPLPIHPLHDQATPANAIPKAKHGTAVPRRRKASESRNPSDLAPKGAFSKPIHICDEYLNRPVPPTKRISKPHLRSRTGPNLPSAQPHDDTPEDQRRVVSDPQPRRYPFLPKTVRVSSLASDFAGLDIHPRPALFRPFPTPEEQAEDPLSLRTALNRYRTTASRRPSPEPGSRSRSPSPIPRTRPQKASTFTAPMKPALVTRPAHDEFHDLRLEKTIGVGPTRKWLRPYERLKDTMEDGLAPEAPAKPTHVPRQPLRSAQELVDPPLKVKSPPKSTRAPPHSLTAPPGDDVAHNAGNTSGVTALTSLPIGTTRPRRLTSSPLKPQTHRVTHGKLCVLPSHDLLIDFREGERRRGKRGDTVFAISASGGTVHIYRNCHDAVPDGLDLNSPDAICTPEEIPRRYWKMWNDAEKLIEHIKQRTPRVRLEAFPILSTTDEILR